MLWKMYKHAFEQYRLQQGLLQANTKYLKVSKQAIIKESVKGKLNPISTSWNNLRDETWSRYFDLQSFTFFTYNIE